MCILVIISSAFSLSTWLSLFLSALCSSSTYKGQCALRPAESILQLHIFESSHETRCPWSHLAHWDLHPLSDAYSLGKISSKIIKHLIVLLQVSSHFFYTYFPLLLDKWTWCLWLSTWKPVKVWESVWLLCWWCTFSLIYIQCLCVWTYNNR